jgi:ABC-type molybdate transport system substrate-binding protein
MKNAKNKDAARAFLDFVKTDQARAALTKYGFTFPPTYPPKAR